MGRFNSTLGLAFVLCAALACGDDDDGGTDSGMEDAGPDTSIGDGGTDTGDDDGGTDAGEDAGEDAAVDAPVDSGPRPRQTRFTAVLATGALSVLAEFDDGSPALLTTAVAHDHMAPPGEDIFASRGSELFRATGLDETTITFGEELPLVDSTGASAEPSIFFDGELTVGTSTLAGVFGANARVYDFSMMEFGGAVPLREAGDVEFRPTSATFVNPGTGVLVLFLKDGDNQIWFLNTATGTIDALLTPIQCSDDSTIAPDLILGARIPGIGPPELAEELIVISGSNAHVLESISPLCFSDAFPLVDSDGAAVTPDAAFGWDFDDNGTDDIVIVDTVEIPEE